jgi:Asp-tRNA(Asn)/Glu-tRNA(Gln) amidotransferase A subunit family amidase
VARLGNTLTATEANRAALAGEMGVADLVSQYLARVEQRNDTVKAWAFIDPADCLRRAQALDAAADKGPLHGVTVGVKDVIDTADMPTEYNSEIYRDHRPEKDAVCVRKLKASGALILGKTETTEFAHAHPTRTVNPHDPARTPGGSSSGSGAAVADGMVAAALGSQTGGSTIRPAAFCGVAGMKPTHGLIDPMGLKPLSHNLDTIGIFGGGVVDLALLLSVLGDTERGRTDADYEPRFAICRTDVWDEAEPDGQEALISAISALRGAGATVRELSFASSFADLDRVHQAIMGYETIRAYDWEWRTHKERISAEFSKFLSFGETVSQDDYERALVDADTARMAFDATLADGEVMVTLSAPGEAPLGFATTGNPLFNRIWTLLHVPCVHLPVGTGPHGLPLGVQLITRRGGDGLLLQASEWAEAAIGSDNLINQGR